MSPFFSDSSEKVGFHRGAVAKILSQVALVVTLSAFASPLAVRWRPQRRVERGLEEQLALSNEERPWERHYFGY